MKGKNEKKRKSEDEVDGVKEVKKEKVVVVVELVV